MAINKTMTAASIAITPPNQWKVPIDSPTSAVRRFPGIWMFILKRPGGNAQYAAGDKKLTGNVPIVNCRQTVPMETKLNHNMASSEPDRAWDNETLRKLRYAGCACDSARS